jgi:parallel beta-helix repeat protein
MTSGDTSNVSNNQIFFASTRDSAIALWYEFGARCVLSGNQIALTGNTGTTQVTGIIGGQDCVVGDNTVLQQGNRTPAYGIQCKSGRTTCSGNVVYSQTAQTVGRGVDAVGSGTVVTGNAIYGYGVGVYAGTTHVSITGNRIDTCDTGITLGSQPVTAFNNSINAQSKTLGISVTGTNNKISGNTINRPNTHGIDMVAASYCVVTGNEIMDCLVNHHQHVERDLPSIDLDLQHDLQQRDQEHDHEQAAVLHR